MYFCTSMDGIGTHQARRWPVQQEQPPSSTTAVPSPETLADLSPRTSPHRRRRLPASYRFSRPTSHYAGAHLARPCWPAPTTAAANRVRATILRRTDASWALQIGIVSRSSSRIVCLTTAADRSTESFIRPSCCSTSSCFSIRIIFRPIIDAMPTISLRPIRHLRLATRRQRQWSRSFTARPAVTSTTTSFRPPCSTTPRTLLLPLSQSNAWRTWTTFNADSPASLCLH